MQSTLQPWLDYIERHVGFILPAAQHRWLSNAINATAEENQLTIDELFAALPTQPKLHQLLIDRVLIAESRFFRDEHALTWIADCYSEHKASQQATPFYVLSVGCSTGQESWSLAMVLEQKKQAYGKLGQPLVDYHVVGVDASTVSLASAQIAHYEKKEWQYIPAVYRRYISLNDDYFEPIDCLKQQVTFVWCNLFDNRATAVLQDELPYPPAVIICQNMLIYFRRFDQRDILQRLADMLPRGGNLVLGAGEALFWQPQTMQRKRHAHVNLWQKLA